MKLKYVAVYDRKRDCGVYHKIAAQVEGFRQAGIEAGLVKAGQWAAQVSVLGRRIDSIHYNWMQLRIGDDVDALYIRYQRSDYSFIRFLGRFKAGKPGRKVVIEIATLPYEPEDGEGAAWTRLKDRAFRRLLRLYADRIVLYSRPEVKHWEGIRCISCVNGIDFSGVTPRRHAPSPDGGIDMIAVASMMPWHGYDRMIEGMRRYKEKGGGRAIRLHLVGNGAEIPRYKEMARKYKLEGSVLFHGQKEGAELDRIYDQCGVGIIGLGYFRMDTNLVSSIKSREYAAKGIPMVTDASVDIFREENCRFIYHVPREESAIDIEGLITWRDGLASHYGTEELLIKAIREIGYKRCDIKTAMGGIIEFLTGRKQ